MADLPTNYCDDVLSESMNGKKKFRLTYRNGTTEEVTIEDISEYDQYGSKFGAGDINKTNQAVNEKFDAEDVVDPMLTTEKGFAADAYKTKLQFDEQNKNLEQVFQSVSDGKALVASAITDMGVETASDATFQTMADNIKTLGATSEDGGFSVSLDTNRSDTRTITFAKKFKKVPTIVCYAPSRVNVTVTASNITTTSFTIKTTNTSSWQTINVKWVAFA